MRLGYAGAALKIAPSLPYASLALASLVLTLAAGAARAGDSVCWIQNGVLLVPAVVAGIDSVFILDTGAPHSQLDATQASEVDIGAAETTGDVRFAERTFPTVRMRVLALDDRTRTFPIPIGGVLGADVLAGQVLEVRPNPCRVRISPSAGALARAGMPMTLVDGVPYVRAAASDGARGALGLFGIDTGSPAPVVLDDPSLIADGRLRGLSMDGRLFEAQAAIARPKSDDGAIGAIGEPIWARFAIRLDFGRKTLSLQPR
jgi:hypothetical protein